MDTHGWFFTYLQVDQRNDEGFLIRRSNEPKIISKQQFLKAFTLKNPE